MVVADQQQQLPSPWMLTSWPMRSQHWVTWRAADQSENRTGALNERERTGLTEWSWPVSLNSCCCCSTWMLWAIRTCSFSTLLIPLILSLGIITDCDMVDYYPSSRFWLSVGDERELGWVVDKDEEEANEVDERELVAGGAGHWHPWRMAAW